MKTFNYYEYNSKRFDRSAKAEQVRNFIFAFKDGKLQPPTQRNTPSVSLISPPR